MSNMTMKTPGVYIVEKKAFPNSIVSVPTAVPAFIGYTEKAVNGAKSLLNVPFRISSMLEYHQYFGGAPEVTTVKNELKDVDLIKEVAAKKKEWEEEKDTEKKKALKLALDTLRKACSMYKNSDIYFYLKNISHSISNTHTLYYHMLLFFANGGQNCYIVSAGEYKNPITKTELENAIDALKQEQEPTIVVVPEAVNLTREDYKSVNRKLLDHCGGVMKNRVAILDIYNGFKPINDAEKIIETFRTDTNDPYLNYASTYYPWFRSSFIDLDKVKIEVPLFDNVHDGLLHIFYSENLAKGDSGEDKTNHCQLSAAELEYQCKLIGADASITDKEKEKDKQRVAIGKNDKLVTEEVKKKHVGTGDPTDAEYKAAAEELLIKLEVGKKKELIAKMQLVSKEWKNIEILNSQMIPDILKYLSPSAAIAGIYAQTDNARGVWKAPGNVSISSILGPAVILTDKDQEELNMPSSGKAINAIRYFTNEGTKVWGVRTLDGNSQDWRYINVRRTMIFLEESIKNAARSYVFEPNDANTWLNMKCMIENFLRDFWKRGGLAGSSPEDAYSVHIGLGETMMPEDILEGIMRITVLVAVSHPAEFIEITFQQQTQKS